MNKIAICRCLQKDPGANEVFGTWSANHASVTASRLIDDYESSEFLQTLGFASCTFSYH